MFSSFNNQFNFTFRHIIELCIEHFQLMQISLLGNIYILSLLLYDLVLYILMDYRLILVGFYLNCFLYLLLFLLFLDLIQSSTMYQIFLFSYWFVFPVEFRLFSNEFCLFLDLFLDLFQLILNLFLKGLDRFFNRFFNFLSRFFNFILDPFNRFFLKGFFMGLNPIYNLSEFLINWRI